MSTVKNILWGTLAAVLIQGSATAETIRQEIPGQGPTKMECPMMQAMHKTPAGPFGAAMATMHQDMAAAPVTGNVDVDFVQGMIPHHQGAIDMAKVVLASGTDPKIKALAEGIVKAQESEIAMMKEWLAQHQAAMPAPKPEKTHGQH